MATKHQSFHHPIEKKAKIKFIYKIFASFFILFASSGMVLAAPPPDPYADAVESIKSGRLDASVAQLPYLVGKQAVEKVTEVLNGGSVEQFIAVPTLVLTKDVLDKGEEPLLEYVK